MSWVLAIAAVWMLLAALLCLFVGRAIQLADHKETRGGLPDAPNVVADQIPRTAAPMTAVAMADAVPASRSASDLPDRPSDAPAVFRHPGGRAPA